MLEDYFLPMKCLPLERHRFRSLEQEETEPIENFVLRLREQGNLCEYGDHLEEEIKEQVFEKGVSDELRANTLTKPRITLAETVELGRSLETINKHRKNLLHKTAVDVNKVSSSSAAGSRNECFRCGRIGHYANDEGCPAKDQKCERCGLTGHFKKRCKTKHQNRNRQRDSGRIREVKLGQQSEDSDDGVSDSEQSDEQCVTCAMGGVKIEWVVDSGARVKVINQTTWKALKDNRIKVKKQSAKCNIPIPLRYKTDKEIERLIAQDIIEPAPKDSRWISRLVIRPNQAKLSLVTQ
nr:uncharacterized protein LOC109621780 [Aedes albopictus]